MAWQGSPTLVHVRMGCRASRTCSARPHPQEFCLDWSVAQDGNSYGAYMVTDSCPKNRGSSSTRPPITVSPLGLDKPGLPWSEKSPHTCLQWPVVFKLHVWGTQTARDLPPELSPESGR